MEIALSEENIISTDILRKITEAAVLILMEEGLPHESAEISLTLVEENEIRQLNRDFREKDAVTDVLSFPQYDDFSQIPEEFFCLGDVVICREVAQRQAEEYGHTFERELVYLFVHSVLHLLGYDHMDVEEKTEMREKEERVMDEIGLSR